ncbi:uncharacterized protein LOC120352189 [Nilaparvata lugens]|uniref:uncharacterized protein LOC120352189 n=1 Tax=Nilaparvata lugens TaxID=108931 RepID=UPI00193E9E3C|nr:uncharacterized protein LOC120352189 [Nilaparvata lugens]
MVILRLTIGNIELFVIQVHAPTSDSAEEEVDLFYDMLDNLLSSKTTGEKVIIFGDFNARIGKSRLGENRTNGIYGVGVRNERGEKLLDFALCNNLKIMNTFFEGQLVDKWSWKSPLDAVHEIDFFIVEKSNNLIKKLEVQKRLDFDTDHRLLMGKLIMPERRYFIKKKQIRTTDLNEQEFVKNLKREMSNRDLSENCSVEEIYEGIVNSISEAARSLNRVRQHDARRSNKLSEETKQLIEERERLNRILNKSEEEKRKHQDLRKEARKRIRKGMKNYEENVIRTIMATSESTKSIHKLISSVKKRWIPKLDTEDGTSTMERGRILEQVTLFYEKLYEEGNGMDHQTERRNTREEEPELRVSDILEQEIKQAIKQLKKNKAPGDDDITNEVIISRFPQSLKHCEIWNALEESGVEVENIEVLKSLYEDNEMYIKLERRGRSIRLRKGLKQGCPLSPIIFNCCLDYAFRRLSWESEGLCINGYQLTNLRFADDVMLVAKSAEEIKEMFDELIEASKKIGLCLNAGKTRVLTNSDTERIDVTGGRIEYVNEYEYLGQLLSFENRTGKDVSLRINKGWKKYWALKKIFKGDFSNELKAKLLLKCVYPAILYGAQNWSLTAQSDKRLETTQTKMIRSILGLQLHHRRRNTDLLKQVKVKYLQKEAHLIKWRWAGHVARMTAERWVEICMEWIPRDRARGRGHPACQWRDELTQRVGDMWPTIARDRKRWEKIIKKL